MSEQRFTNRLIDETSPYLLQHAHNPVDWHPWGPEALERAKSEDKPILLSIGYSACHWCHVMEHESFENEEIAELMNENFICIKVDREERPDLDSIYMNVVQMITGHGGWPMTVFLTPDLKPFYGGTYFPPDDRHGLPGFPRLLLAMADTYHNRRDEVTESADSITAELGRLNQFRATDDLLTTEVLNQAFSRLTSMFDNAYGGFGRQPKFPPSMTLMFLLRHHQRTGSAEALQMVEFTLQKMAAGGMYDHLGGGFARYSVDARWLVPHFEKMLYDNALLARIYLYAFQATKKAHYRQVAEEILEYIIRDMTDSSGAFYSAEDADSEGEEGKFYIWTKDEVIEILGAEEGELFCSYFDITAEGNFEHGTSILNTPTSIEDVAQENQVSVEKLRQIISTGKKRLFNVRSERVRPGLDDKTLTAWNAMMLTAFAEAANILARDDYRQVAIRSGDFLIASLVRDGRALRTWKGGKAKLNGYLEDYSYLIEGLVALYEATFDLKYFTHSRALAETMIEYFLDEREGGFYFTSSDHEKLITRSKDYFDNATPSGNSVAVIALLKLWLLTHDSRYRQLSATILRTIREAMAKFPNGFGYMLCALDFYLSQSKEIAIVGKLASHEVRSFIEEIYSRFLPDKAIAACEPGDTQAASAIPLLEGRVAVDTKATVYVCENFSCQLPATSIEELRERLGD